MTISQLAGLSWLVECSVRFTNSTLSNTEVEGIALLVKVMDSLKPRTKTKDPSCF